MNFCCTCLLMASLLYAFLNCGEVFRIFTLNNALLFSRKLRPLFFGVGAVSQQVVPVKNYPVLAVPNVGHDTTIHLDNHRRFTLPLHVPPPVQSSRFPQSTRLCWSWDSLFHGKARH